MKSISIFTSLGLTAAVLAACAKTPDERCEPQVTYDMKGAVLYEPVIEGDCQPYFAPQVAAGTGGGGGGGQNGGTPGNGNGPPDNGGNGPPDNGGNGPPDNGDGAQVPSGSVRAGVPARGSSSESNGDGGGSGGGGSSPFSGFSVRAGNT